MTWEQVRLRDLGTWYGGGTPSKANTDFWTNGDLPWLSPKDMGPEILLDTKDRVTAAAVAGSSTKLVPAGAVAVVTRSGILERTIPVALVPFATTMNQDMKAVVPHGGIDPRWIAWGLRAFERDLLRDTRKAGTTVASIEMPRWYNFALPVPALAEQRRILAILEAHLSRLDAADASLRNSVKRLERMGDAARDRALARAQTDSDSSSSIGELALVSSGTTPLKGNRAFYEGGTVPWITSGDLWQGIVTQAKQFVTQKAVDETSLKLMPAGALLVAMYGEGKTRGTVAELAIAATTNQACAGIVLSNTNLRPWVHLVLRANYGALRRMAAGGVQPNLNLSLIRSIQVPLPDYSVRERLLGELAEIDVATWRLKQGLLMAERRSAALRRSLLAAAFSGRLTGTSTEMCEIAGLINA